MALFSKYVNSVDQMGMLYIQGRIREMAVGQMGLHSNPGGMLEPFLQVKGVSRVTY